MSESKSSKNVLSVDDEVEFSHWQLPDITRDQSQDPSNMFGKSSQPYQAKTVTAEKSMSPPTMAQIEDIRAAAEQEGFEQGKQDGYQQGLEQGRLEGLEQGHSEGFTQGEQQGLEAGQVAVNQLIEQLTQLITQFEQPLAVLDSEIEAELLAMTISLAKSVIGHELKTHPEHILSALRQGVDALPLKEQRVKLRLTQHDADIVSQNYPQEQLQKNQWQIDIDPTLSNGDCVIESVRSSVDLRVEQRIEQVFTELEEQATQLTKNAQQLKVTTPNYQSSEVDDLAAYSQTAVEQTHDADNPVETAHVEKNQVDDEITPSADTVTDIDDHTQIDSSIIDSPQIDHIENSHAKAALSPAINEQQHANEPLKQGAITDAASDGAVYVDAKDNG
ncbi:flagellar assembly protein FliH [Shewanella ulleungensis]|uniref:Flagellar assembly protein FliH n=1 Tax=Shewanella ulleungensis TaxID=2282699 RepID=A0ABQ2QYT9_9GAMM|nr:flagellar assembly protein FliH [Shewanella ulleungensis]MCL1152095.1 flagellar assembly protein FliH [Shewanella ulleungensis]GGP99868.1 flagellar assembly protein FliH [Shewanella ulleungensis]